MEEKFDYNKLRDETSVMALRDIYMIIGQEAEELANTTKTTKTREEIQERYAKVAQRFFEVIASNRVPDNDMRFLSESVSLTLLTIFNIVAKEYRELETEFLARTIGALDPGTGKYSREYATIEDFFGALRKIRAEQDADGVNHYQLLVSDEKADEATS